MNLWKISLPLALLALGGCDIPTDAAGITGSGKRVVVARELPPFHAVDIGCGCRVVLVVMPQSVSVAGDDNIVPHVTTEVVDGTLRVRANRTYLGNKDVQVNIALPAIDRFEFGGAGDIELSGLTGERLAISISGAGNVEATGEVGELQIKLAGAGKIDARNLHARTVRARLAGAGKADIFASEELDAETAGAGSITYYGEPKRVHTKVSGVGKIDRN